MLKILPLLIDNSIHLYNAYNFGSMHIKYQTYSLFGWSDDIPFTFRPDAGRFAPWMICHITFRVIYCIVYYVLGEGIKPGIVKGDFIRSVLHHT